MYFLVLGSDKPDMEAVRSEVRPTHREYLRKPGRRTVVTRMGGPKVRENGAAMNRTLLVVEADNIDQVRAFVADDRYSRSGLFQLVEIRPWNCGLNALPAIG
jgi:uncharacterized protein YciI